MDVKLNRKATSYKELIEIIETVGGYPVVAQDFDGTKLAITYQKNEGAIPSCTVWEPGDERGTKTTVFYEDGKTEVIFKND